MTVDRWGQEISGAPSSVAAWDAAWGQFVHFRGDPLATLAPAVADDESFVLGPMFTAAYLVLGGTSPTSASVVDAVARARRRALGGNDRERAHVAALDLLVDGETTAAGGRWDAIVRAEPDFTAARLAHDVFLHVADDTRRLASSQAAADRWGDRAGRGFVRGQLAFALEEAGRLDEAERLGHASLADDPDDLWSRHALAHVHETRDDTGAARELLEGSVDVWADQDGLALHLWWHLALRLLAAGDVTAVLDIHDRHLARADTAFRLSDPTSLLWRVELAGHDVGDRWDALADAWAAVEARHTVGFLDLHATLAFLRRPDHPGATVWWDGLAHRPDQTTPPSENDEIFAAVVRPLVDALRATAGGDRDALGRTLDALGPATARIGGSIAQRDVLPLTREHFGVTA